ncbi:MAG: cyclic nucleotide-binding domain-containing protein [Lachnospiraceae bacterium]|nr:cyclic nucleotide-binding domain-containing protein [Lachnospiraceae bacterium]
MDIRLKMNEMNEIQKGTVFYTEGEPVRYICVVLKGCVELYNQGSRVILGNGCFLGVQDIYLGRALASCAAVDDTVIYAFPADGVSSVEKILSMNKDYRGLLMYSAVRIINNLYRAGQEFKKQATTCSTWLTEAYKEYIALSSQAGLGSIRQPGIEKIPPFDETSLIDYRKLSFYLESAAVPVDVMKAFYGYGAGITLFPLEQASGVMSELVLECMESAGYLEELLTHLVGEDGASGFFAALISFGMKTAGGELEKVAGKRIDECMEQINALENLFEKKTGCKPCVNREKIEKLYLALLTGEHTEEMQQEETQAAERLSELTDSVDQILKYSGIDAEKAEQFKTLIEQFETSENRMGTEDDARRLRRSISVLFYDLYEETFMRARGRMDLPAAVELFLDFGYVSEKLLDKKTLDYFISRIGSKHTGTYGKDGKVYTVREWLEAVYSGKREPSKSEMDEDYMEYVRGMRKSSQITDAQEKQLMANQKEKLHYEVRNMFQSNNRIVNGQISTFVPVLHQDMIMQDLDRTMLTLEKIESMVMRLRKVDYSVFYRDVLYSRPDKGIDKIYIMKEFYPDIILMPTVGSRPSMWQECSCKRRESAGRFVFPTFFEEDFEAAMVKTMGRYRWELCRFLQGGSWNNIKYRSLTSEYCDYLQFYKKNHDLSEEKKEKLKLQIQKGKNNSREVFVIDYELWVRNESSGAIRLNKTARDILAMYCPFSKPVRAKLSGQPMFEEAFAKPERERAKSAHDLDLRIRQIKKEGKTEVPPEVEETMRYYIEN